MEVAPQFSGRVRIDPGGVHYFDRDTGLNILLDEVKPPPPVWSAAPRHVSVAITNACDLKCSFCFAPKEPARLSATKLRPWIDELDTHGCLGIGFGGGEPTLHPDLPSICESARRDTRLAVTLTTHGHHLTETLARELRTNVHFIRLSMDGTGATYERIRGRPFDEFLRRLELAVTIAKCGVNYVVTDDTVQQLDRAASLLADFGVEELLLLPKRPVARHSPPKQETLAALSRWARSYAGPLRLSTSAPAVPGLPTLLTHTDTDDLRAYAHIDSVGVLKRTSFAPGGLHIGSNGVISTLRRLKMTTENQHESLARIRI